MDFQNEDTCMYWINEALHNGAEIPADVWAKCQDWAALRNGWTELRTVAHELTSALENAQQTITIGYNNDMPDVQGRGCSPVFSQNGDLLSISIGLDPNNPGGITQIAGKMAHEAFHALACLNGYYDDFTTYQGLDSRFAETLAYALQCSVLRELGVKDNEWGNQTGDWVFQTFGNIRIISTFDSVAAVAGGKFFDIKAYTSLNVMPSIGTSVKLMNLFYRYYPLW